MTLIPRFAPTGPVLVRVTTDPGDLDVPTDLDLTDPHVVQADGRAWLAKTWARDDVREALTTASPALAVRAGQLLDDAATPAVKDLRRAITATVSYLLRWQRRCTPFGMFAGVTTATTGPAAARIATRHPVVARPDGDWLTAVCERVESSPRLRARLTVVADNLAVVRDGRVTIARRTPVGGRTAGGLQDASVRYTRPVAQALTAAAAPIAVGDLADAVAAAFPAAAPTQIWALLDDLIAQQFLITGVRPPMSAPDPLAHLIAATDAAGGARIPDVATLLDQLEQLRAMLDKHNRATDPATAADLRRDVQRRMREVAGGTDHVLALDTRLDAHVQLPAGVLAEAARAATVLLRLSTKPFGAGSWLDYHARFRARYGPGALVPVRELVADSGLGYPTGYLGAPRARPVWRTLTERDAAFLTLVQRAALDGADEITLTDTDVDALTVGDPGDTVVPSRIELGVAVDAACTEDLDRGRFTLRVTAAPQVPTSMAGRFTHLLDDTSRVELAAGYQATEGDAVVVQLTFPPRRPHDENITRVAALLPNVVAVGEHPGGGAIGVDDLAVTADDQQMYLVQASTGRRVIPRIPHALDLTVQSPPLVRFLAEVADARSAVFGAFDVGAARTLPYLPRIRYGRTVLAAARWLLTPADLPTADSGWDDALDEWRRRWRVPARVVLCHGELRLPLDLDGRLDQALLRTHLRRADRLELRQDAPPGTRGWTGGRPAEVLIPMAAVEVRPRRLPPLVAPTGPDLPGASAMVQAVLAGNPARFDDIIAGPLPALGAALHGLVDRWWMRRHRDMIRLDADHALVLVLRLTDPGGYATAVAALNALTARLHTDGLPAALTLQPYQHHPGRYGHGPARDAAEQVFAADTSCAAAQLAAARASGVPAQAWAAASMAHLATAFAPDPDTGRRSLLDCLPQQTGPLDRALRDHALSVADPAADYKAVRPLPGGDAVAAAWHARAGTLAAYWRTLATQGDPDTVLPALLHDHHVRAVGVDPTFEKVTNRLARAAVLRLLAGT